MLELRILFLNWKDLDNPAAGGAETYTEEISKRLVTFGHQVTIFASSFDGSDSEASHYGVRIIRQGGRVTVYSKARNYVRSHLSDYDLFIDEINTVPFRIARIAKTKRVIALIHQLAREIWFYETRFPLNLIGYFGLEPFWIRQYRDQTTITVSNSTREDLLKLGFKRIRIVQNGISVSPMDSVPRKDVGPVMIFLGRLVRSKHPEHAIQALIKAKSRVPDAQLWMVGDGYLRPKLEAKRIEGVRFFGKVTHEEKFELLKKARVMLVPSVREGWGISVIEANAMGTPAIGYSVPGLRDSIVDGRTGVLVKRDNVEGLANAASNILLDAGKARQMGEQALDWSKRFTWEKSALQFNNVIAENSELGKDMRDAK